MSSTKEIEGCGEGKVEGGSKDGERRRGGGNLKKGWGGGERREKTSDKVIEREREKNGEVYKKPVYVYIVKKKREGV